MTNQNLNILDWCTEHETDQVKVLGGCVVLFFCKIVSCCELTELTWEAEA